MNRALLARLDQLDEEEVRALMDDFGAAAQLLKKEGQVALADQYQLARVTCRLSLTLRHHADATYVDVSRNPLT